MRTSLKKFRGLALPKHDKQGHHLRQSRAKLDELSQASQDMQDMRDCYDSLLSAAAATANSAYEFSESLREMGDCLLEKTALNDDEESGKVLLMLGKVQFVIQSLVDRYRKHISQTITIPSESLLNELRIVEEMKKQCDEKRIVYENMIPKGRGKGRSRSSKGDYISSRELQAACDEYDEEASLFVFRMKSLKRGQSRSLLTQAARHHAAQMSFFGKAFKSLEEIEPHVELISEEQHIPYHFSGLEDDDDEEEEEEEEDGDETGDDDDDYVSVGDIDDDSEDHDDNELSFDHGKNDLGQDNSKSRDTMELDKVDLIFPKASTVDAVKEYSNRKPGGNSFIFGRDLDPSSKSAPLLVEKEFDSVENFQPTRQSSTRKFYTYVLPTPDKKKSPDSLRLDTQVPQTRRASVSGGTPNLWHSSPLETQKNVNTVGGQSGPILSNTQSVLKESNSNTTSSRLTPPMFEGLSSQLDHRGNAQKARRQAFSGPLTGKSWSNRPNLSVSGPIDSTGNALLFSGSLLRTPLPKPSSTPVLSSNVSPNFKSSPIISELHELPRPPAHLILKGPSNLSHSSPLMSKGQELSATNNLMPSNASTLPIPPETVHRSYSIPSRGQRGKELHMPKNLEAPQNLKLAEDLASPPFTPISLSNS